MLKHPDPANSELYSLLYTVGSIKGTSKFVYLPIASQHPNFNPTVQSYATEARLFAKMYLDNGYIDKIFGKLPSTYQQNLNKLVMPYPIFDVTNDGGMILSFPMDQNIYVLDNEMHILNYFGQYGRNMDTNYHSTKNIDSFNNVWKEQTLDRGYYTDIKYISSLDETVRCYQKSSHATTDGLQIYKQGKLIGDFDVPNGFKVSAYIAPYYYSDVICNENNKTIKFYRLKLIG